MNNKESIAYLEKKSFDFANGLDQQIHGMDYDSAFKIYSMMMEDLQFLKENKEYKLLLLQDKSTLVRRNIDYIIQK